MTAWKVLSSLTVLDNPWLRIREQRVLLPNGREIEAYHVIDGADWAAVLAVTEQRQAVLVEQYRHGSGAQSLELPAGALESGEQTLAAAQRELLEETGYIAADWQPIVSVFPEPSRHTHTAHFFIARGARLTRAPNPDATESLGVRLVGVSELVALALSGGIGHGVHIGPILIAARHPWLTD